MLKDISLYITLLVLVGIAIQKVIATDCDVYKNIANYLGNDYRTRYSQATNCCTFSDITCDGQNNIIKIKLSGIIKAYNDNFNMESAVGEMEKLNFLTSLEISNMDYYDSSKWNGMPRNIGNLKNLKSLTFSNNNIGFLPDSLPDELGNLTNLEVLDINHAIVKGKFPDCICKLTNLKSLNINHNEIEGVIPYECKNLTNLENIDIGKNFHMKGYFPVLPKLKSCNFDLTDLCTLPESQCQSEEPCSTQDIINTNGANGNPDSTSDKYEGYTGNNSNSNDSKSNNSKSNNSKSSSSYKSNKSDGDDDKLSYIYKLLKVISAAIAVITAICSLWYYYKKASKGPKNDQINIININDSSSSSKTNTNINTNTNTNSSGYPSQTTQQLHPLQTYALSQPYPQFSPQPYSAQQYSPQPHSPYYNALPASDAPPEYSTLPKYSEQAPFLNKNTSSSEKNRLY